MTDLEALFGVLADGGVQFILVGGIAATAHGSARTTYDLDIVYSRTPDNLARMAAALLPYEPSLRGAPAGLPFRLDVETLRQGLNFTLSTRLGPLDLLGEIAGGGSYPSLVKHTIEITLFGQPCRCITLDKLIEVKRAAGRPKDLDAVAELEALREERAP